MNNTDEATLSKVPELTLLFWIIKIAATTLADFADRSLGIGYAGGTALLLTCYTASALLLVLILACLVLFILYLPFSLHRQNKYSPQMNAYKRKSVHLGVDTIARRLAVLGHHDDGGLDGGEIPRHGR